MKRCKNSLCKKLTTNAKYCSRECFLICRIKYMKRHKLLFFNSGFQKKHGAKGGVKGAKTNKRNKTGFYGMTHQQHVMAGKKAALANKKNKSGAFHDIYIQRLGGLIGGKKAGQAAVKQMIKNSKHKWFGVGFLSKMEKDCAMIILTRQKVGYNCHIKVGAKTIDFFPQNSDKLFKNIFVEFHPIVGFMSKGQSEKTYFKERRKMLDKNGYKENKLIVLNSLKELKHLEAN